MAHIAKARSKIYTCHGGPFDKQEIVLTTEGTLTFKLGDYRGRYVRRLNNDRYVNWENLNV